MSNRKPYALPAVPLKNGVLFPLQLMPLSVGRPRSVAAMQAAMQSEDKSLVIVAQRHPENEEPRLRDLYDVGTVAVVKRVQQSGQGIQAIVLGTSRVRLAGAVSEDPYLKAELCQLPEPADTSTAVEALHAELVKLAARAFELLQPQTNIPFADLFRQSENPLRFVYVLASVFSLGTEREMDLLAADTRAEALRIMHKFLSHEVQVLELRQHIASEAQTELSRQQREYMLRQQLREIQEELGEENPEQAEVTELRKRLDETDLPEAVHKEMEKELSRLERMSSAAADYQVVRTYVELALELPWKNTTEDVLDLVRARQILDEDHYDLQDVKDRIIEHLAVMKLNPKAKGPILCFVGPPGTGKTSVGQSIARSMGRKFERMSLGGLHDEAELARPSSHLCGSDAGTDHSSHPQSRRKQPAVDARRSRQAGSRLPRRSSLGVDGDSRSGAEPRVP